MSLVALLGVSQAHAQSATTNYIGAEKCKSCHEFEYQVWSQGPHAKAFMALKPEELKDAKCNGCHTMQTLVPADVSLPGVQCERCHGPGKFYQPRYVMKDRELARAVGLVDPTSAQCMQCHTDSVPSIKPFDFNTMWAKIDHGKAAREAWQKARK